MAYNEWGVTLQNVSNCLVNHRVGESGIPLHKINKLIANSCKLCTMFIVVSRLLSMILVYGLVM